MNVAAAVKPTGFKGIVYWICIVASLGGLLFGLDQGFIANALPTIQKVYGLNLSGSEAFSAILFTGAAIGAFLSGFLARGIGRKGSLLLSGALFVIMAGWSAFLPNYEILYWLRFFLGFAIGIASFVVPLYLAEAAPAKIRGSMGTLFQLMITIGIFGISLTNVIFIKLISSHVERLPLMFLVIVLFALIMFIGGIFIPESPRWYMLKGKKDKAINVLKKILNSQEEVDFEIKEMEEVLGLGAGKKSGTVFTKTFLKVVLVGAFMMIFQQLVGINVMIYYAPRIFGYAGITGIIAMMTVPVVNLLFTFPAIWLVEKWGRKKLLYAGSIIMCVSMFVAAFVFLSIGTPAPGVAIGGFSKVILVVAVIVYIFGFAFSWGPVAWLICSEIFPIQGREVGMTITTMINWFWGGIVIAHALTIMKLYGNASLFFIFAFGCILSIVFLYFWVPETRGVTLEEIEENLRNGKKLKHIGS